MEHNTIFIIIVYSIILKTPTGINNEIDLNWLMVYAECCTCAFCFFFLSEKQPSYCHAAKQQQQQSARAHVQIAHEHEQMSFNAHYMLADTHIYSLTHWQTTEAYAADMHIFYTTKLNKNKCVSYCTRAETANNRVPQQNTCVLCVCINRIVRCTWMRSVLWISHTYDTHDRVMTKYA